VITIACRVPSATRISADSPREHAPLRQQAAVDMRRTGI